MYGERPQDLGSTVKLKTIPYSGKPETLATTPAGILTKTPGSSKRRDKFYIIAEVLEIARSGALKTQIMYRANLSFTQLNEYLAFMERIELLERANVNNKNGYKTSEKGLDFLQRYIEINELLETEKNGIQSPPHRFLDRK